MNDLLQPWNLIFVLPFGCALLLLFLTCLGLLPDGHDSGEIGDWHAGDVHTGDMTAEMDHFSTVHAPETGGDHATANLHDTAGDSPPFWQGLLILIGFGRVPASLLLMCFGFFWGFIGWSTNHILGSWLPPTVFIWPSLLIATLMSATLTRTLAGVLSRYMPSSESYAISGFELAGRTARVRYRVTENSGTAQIYDRYDNLHEVSCRIAPGGEEILSGEEVLLVSFEEDEGFYRVCRNPIELRVTERKEPARPLPPSPASETPEAGAEPEKVIEGEV